MHCFAKPGPKAGAVATALAILTCGVLGALGALTGLSQYQFGFVRQYNISEPLTAFDANLKALNLFDWDVQTRLQLTLSLHNVISKYRQSQVSDEAADRVYRISSSASPYSTAVLMMRAETLMLSGRSPDEMRAILTRLMTHNTLQPETWLLVSAFAYQQGELPAAYEAAQTGLRCRVIDPPVADALTRITRFIETTP